MCLKINIFHSDQKAEARNLRVTYIRPPFLYTTLNQGSATIQRNKAENRPSLLPSFLENSSELLSWLRHRSAACLTYDSTLCKHFAGLVRRTHGSSSGDKKHRKVSLRDWWRIYKEGNERSGSLHIKTRSQQEVLSTSLKSHSIMAIKVRKLCCI